MIRLTAVTSTWSTALDEAAADLLQQAGWNEPPIDALELADRLGAVVALDSAQTTRGRHARLGGRPSIFLKPDERPERVQWAAAHEIGEFAAWRVFERVAVSEDEITPRLREGIANLMASRLLLPADWFREAAAECDADLLRLKERFATASHELIAWRLLDLPGEAIITIFDHGRVTRRRGNGSIRTPRLQPVEHALWRRVHAENRPHETRHHRLRVQGWPIHEPGWKREILRTMPRGDDE
jgi:predicted transcriptional regulator